MAYESNRIRLHEMMGSRDFGMNEEQQTALRNSDSEPFRAGILNQVFQRDMDTFDSVPLWLEGAPGLRTDVEWQSAPRLAFFPCPDEGRHGVVLVSPGGGYNCKVSETEGYPYIRRLLESGFHAALLDYRVKPYPQTLSLLDIQRAIRLLRYRADEWGILPDHIAVMGSSAGGHLSSMAAVHCDGGIIDAADPVERFGCRPDAAIICYGTFSQVAFPGGIPFMKISENDPPQEQPVGLVSPYSDKSRAGRFFFSPEKHVTPETPPFFFWQTCDEDDPRFLFNMARELTDCAVRFEAHIFPHGRHGLGLADGNGFGPKDPHVMRWFELAAEWLKGYGF